MTELLSSVKRLKWKAGREKVGSVEPKGPRPDVPFAIVMKTGKDIGKVTRERRMKDAMNMIVYMNRRLRTQRRVNL